MHQEASYGAIFTDMRPGIPGAAAEGNACRNDCDRGGRAGTGAAASPRAGTPRAAAAILTARIKKVLAFVLAALSLGAASAQDTDAMCRTFCEADAKECRDGKHPDAWAAADALLHLRGSPSVAPDKHEQALSDADGERKAHLQQCARARQTCRQECTAPVAASAPASAASATR